MKKKYAESELEFLETSEEARDMGLKRIKRRHYKGPIKLLNGNTASPDLLLEKLRERLLSDEEFADRLKEKLVA